MRLTILSVAFPFAAVGPDAVGGAEQVPWQIDRALVLAGHESVVVAAEGSRVSGELVATRLPRGVIDAEVKCAAHTEHRARIESVLRTRKVDVLHFHGIDFNRYLPLVDRPAVVTLHLPVAWYDRSIFERCSENVYLHCVSQTQRRSCPEARLLPTIENGVPLEALNAKHAKRRFALTLGRICPEKNFHVAMDAGTRVDVPVLVGGCAFAYEPHQAYFRNEVLPRARDFHRVLGPLDFGRKRRLMTAARCLLVPSTAPETSSLVAMEALACGTPVIAFAAGALTEIVEHGRTGFIVRDESEMADAIVESTCIRPDHCRARARERFSVNRMSAEYLALYERLACITSSSAMA